jgi:hypothetical protein
VEIERESVMTFTVGLPTLPNMFGMKADDGTEGRSRLALWPLGIAATGFGIWGLSWFSVGTHITDCGFDAKGAYAEVRARGASEVWVDFDLDGTQYTYAGAYNVRGTTVLRAHFPPMDHHHISGRTVYVVPKQHDKFVTRKFAEAHPGRTLTEVVPDASHTLSCRFDYTDPD